MGEAYEKIKRTSNLGSQTGTGNKLEAMYTGATQAVNSVNSLDSYWKLNYLTATVFPLL